MEEVEWVLAMCLGLNSYWGGPIFNEGEITKSHCVILESFLHDVHRLFEIRDTVDEFNWAEFFKSRTIDYKLKLPGPFAGPMWDLLCQKRLARSSSGMYANRDVGFTLTIFQTFLSRWKTGLL